MPKSLAASLEFAILFSEPQDPNTGAAYQVCNAVAQAAHQLSRTGIIAPAATQRGHTLALFTDLLLDEEKPRPVGASRRGKSCQRIPADSA
jgi:hypothetical protein